MSRTGSRRTSNEYARAGRFHLSPPPPVLLDASAECPRLDLAEHGGQVPRAEPEPDDEARDQADEKRRPHVPGHDARSSAAVGSYASSYPFMYITGYFGNGGWGPLGVPPARTRSVSRRPSS